MKDSEIEVGMKVIMSEGVKNCGFGTVDLMSRLVGEKVTISGKRFVDFGGCYLFNIKEDVGNFNYDANCFSPVQTTSKNKMTWIDDAEYELVPTGKKRKSLDALLRYPVTAICSGMVTDFAVLYPRICVAVAKVDGITKIGMAQCSSQDEFNEDIGIALAVFRALGLKDKEENLLYYI